MPDGLELTSEFTRRDFMRLSGMGLLSLALPLHWGRNVVEAEATQLGRVAFPTVDVMKRASFASESVRTLWRDEILDIEAAVLGDLVPEHNRIWYLVRNQGFIHSSGIQPVENKPNEPLTSVPYRGILMEVTVPYVDAFWKPRTDSNHAYRFYYSQTHWITGVSQDVSLRKWYRIMDDKYDYVYYAPAEAFQRVPISELIPISSDVPAQEKRVWVDLSRQWLNCYEGSQLVFSSKISSGRKFDDATYWTPEGEFVTFRKRPSRHMSSGNRATGYDLPGVPWVAYINEDGVAFHGTFWHNDFGSPRSHGCINMTPQAAKWLFRWTQPIVPATEQEIWVNYGTKALVSV